jgi:hypothetical protein
VDWEVTENHVKNQSWGVLCKIKQQKLDLTYVPSQSWNSIDKKMDLKSQPAKTSVRFRISTAEAIPLTLLHELLAQSLSPSTPVGSYILHLPVGQRKGSFCRYWPFAVSLKEVWGSSPAVGVGQLLRDFGILGSMQPLRP